MRPPASFVPSFERRSPTFPFQRARPGGRPATLPSGRSDPSPIFSSRCSGSVCSRKRGLCRCRTGAKWLTILCNEFHLYQDSDRVRESQSTEIKSTRSLYLILLYIVTL